MKVLFLIALFVIAHQTQGLTEEQNWAEIDSIENEKECILQGGICVVERDCIEPTSAKGLCPQQRGKGVECCYGVSMKETRCRKRGGECFPKNYCHINVKETLATDCKENEECCILV